MAFAKGALVVAAVVFCFGAESAGAADLGDPHHRHHRHVPVEAPAPPPGYAYGGYGNGPGPGWVDGPGYTPGYGYIPAGAPRTIFDLGY